MLTADDKFAIQELIARFAFSSDYCDWDLLATLYTDDVVTEMEGIPIKYEGIAAQVEHAKESARQLNGKNRHYNFNMMVGEVGDEVVAQYYFLNVDAGSEPMSPKMMTSGRMRDTVVKTGGVWKISRKFVRFDQSFNLNF